MRSKLIFAVVALLLLIPLTAAATTVKLTTLPGRDVFISAWSENLGYQISPPEHFLSDVYGHVEYSYEKTTSPFEVLVIVKNALTGIQEYREELGPYNAGGTVELPALIPDGYVNPLDMEDDPTNDPPADNPTDDETDNPPADDPIDNETEDNQTNITGNAISDEGIGLEPETMKIIYYVLGSIFVVGIIGAIVIFVMMKVRHHESTPRYGMEPVNLDKRHRQDHSGDKDLDSIESEIENVERQIDMYKKRNRLSDAEKRLEEKKKMLERIKRGEKIESHKEERDSKYKRRFD
ncbi:MAG: hypothetical protein ABH864_04740 [archaeon]